MLEQEQTELMPMPTVFDGYVERSGKVWSTWFMQSYRRVESGLLGLENQAHGRAVSKIRERQGIVWKS